jgi:hypothetical protein
MPFQASYAAAVLLLIGGCGEQSNAPRQVEAPSNTSGEKSLGPKEAAQHVGETITVCGVVSSARYLAESTGRANSRKPTFLNFGGKFPNHDFTAVIFDDNREKFGEPEKSCLNKSVCVSGKVQTFREKPEMILTEPGQLKGC